MVKKSMPFDVKKAAVDKWQSYLALFQKQLLEIMGRLAAWAGSDPKLLSQPVCKTEGRYLRSCYIVFRVLDHYELIHIEENRQNKPASEDGLDESTVELFSELLSLETDWISQQQQREDRSKKPDS